MHSCERDGEKKKKSSRVVLAFVSDSLVLYSFFYASLAAVSLRIRKAHAVVAIFASGGHVMSQFNSPPPDVKVGCFRSITCKSQAEMNALKR